MITLAIILITAAISIIAFSNHALFTKFQLNPYQVIHRKEYHRLLTHGFLHADWMHLLVNMFVLYSFGTAVETGYFKGLENSHMMKSSAFYYAVFYIFGILMSSLTTLKKQKDNVYYNAVGASGAVSAVVFTSIFFEPWAKIYFFAIIPVPGIIFGILYLWYSHYMSKKNSDNINHDAHFIGAVYGLVFPLLISPKLFFYFISKLVSF
jgi:membrane associated rhomboid family serine protease